mmetsp:Transcript_27228/g.59177  ORF Transcript_27228/g.59177 Transcript_27228/m.59177 type:complete len:222 (+) Transcript_27228:571-1236(+)
MVPSLSDCRLQKMAVIRMEDRPLLPARDHMHPKVTMPLVHVEPRLRVGRTDEERGPAAAEAVRAHRLLQVAVREVPRNLDVVKQTRKLQRQREVVEVQTFRLVSPLPKQRQNLSEPQQLGFVLSSVSSQRGILEVSVDPNAFFAEIRTQPLSAQAAALLRQKTVSQTLDNEWPARPNEVSAAARKAQLGGGLSHELPRLLRPDEAGPLRTPVPGWKEAWGV